MIKMILKSDYLIMTAALFLSFLGHGMGGMIISQNRGALESQWADPAFFGTVMSMVGWGRLTTFFIAGKLSDVLGRKFFIVLGSFVYIVGLVGMAYTTTLGAASIFAFMFGAANSFLDVGIYPALIEAYPSEAKKVNTALVIFLRIAQLILPLIMLGVFSATGMGINFRISFFMVAAIFALNLILVLIAKFPDHKATLVKQKEEPVTSPTDSKDGIASLFTIEGIAFIVYGFISMGTFMIIQQFSNRFGEAALSMDADIANFIPTFFAVGSIIGVIIAIIAQSKFKAVDVMVALTATSLVATLLVRFVPSVSTLIIGTVLIGFAAAGGVLQMGITLMTEMIPMGKGVVSGIFLSMGSIASIVVPMVVSAIEAQNHLNVMLFNAGLAAVGLLCAIVINIRFKAIEREKGGA
jgi:MFS family permease